MKFEHNPAACQVEPLVNSPFSTRTSRLSFDIYSLDKGSSAISEPKEDDLLSRGKQREEFKKFSASLGFDSIKGIEGDCVKMEVSVSVRKGPDLRVP